MFKAVNENRINLRQEKIALLPDFVRLSRFCHRNLTMLSPKESIFIRNTLKKGKYYEKEYGVTFCRSSALHGL